MKNNKLLFLKQIWLLGILFFVSLYFVKNYSQILDTFLLIPMKNIIYSILFLLIGKIFLALSMKLSLNYTGTKLSLYRSFSIYNITQLAKYIPGSIWQFIGKIGYYKKEGIDNRQIKISMMLEISWLLLSAFVFGFLLVLILDPYFFKNIIIRYSNYIFFIGIIFFIIIFYYTRKYSAILLSLLKKTKLHIIMAGIQIMIWIFLGLSFYILIEPFLMDNSRMLFIIGYYAVAYLFGFIAVFAPAGIGVREGILLLALPAYISPPMGVIIVSTNRIIYIITEVVLALVDYMIKKLSNKKIERKEFGI